MPDTLLAGLRAFAGLLAAANQRTNLTRIEGEEQFVELHALDALLALPHLGGDGALVDVGSGGGVPGLVLALARPDQPVVLVESTQRKAEFLRTAAESLGLSRVVVRCERAEAVGQGALRESAAFVTARALGPLATCLELTLPLVEVGGRAVLYRGPSLDQEADLAASVAAQLGGGAPRAVAHRLPSGAERRLLIVPKAAASPARFPRRVGVPAKRPLA